MILRWICEKCNKKWIYPVSKCIYCKGHISKQKGTKLKVIGITKVMIPSPMHPIIPYNILLLQDEHGNKIPKKTMKDFKIGDNFAVEKAKTESAVSISRVKYDVYEAIKESIEYLNGIGIGPKDKVLIKPSIVAAAYPYQAVNTNPEFIDGLIAFLLESGIKKENILVAEQALIGSDSTDAASKAGILEICKKHDVKFADISKGPFEVVELEGMKFGVFREALHRKIINAPVMKTNFQLGLSGAMENLTRLADEATQREMYFYGIHKIIPLFSKIFSDVFNVADSTNGMQGQGPLGLGEPAFLNLVLSSRNAENLDSIFCGITMLKQPLYVGTATKDIEVVGNEIDALKYPIKAPSPNETPHADIKVIDGMACPACLNFFYVLSSRLIGLRGQELYAAIGSQINDDVLEGKNRLVAYGQCAIRKFKELDAKPMAEIDESMDPVEQIVLMKKLLTTEGKATITPVDRVRSKMKKLLSRVAK